MTLNTRGMMEFVSSKRVEGKAEWVRLGQSTWYWISEQDSSSRTISMMERIAIASYQIPINSTRLKHEKNARAHDQTSLQPTRSGKSNERKEAIQASQKPQPQTSNRDGQKILRDQLQGCFPIFPSRLHLRGSERFIKLILNTRFGSDILNSAKGGR